jgi:uncharacterized membrane protein
MTEENTTMATHPTAKSGDYEPDIPPKFLTLLILGFSVMILGLVLVAIATVLSQGGSTSFGGIIFIGPLPIVFGAGPRAQWLILFAVILTVLSVITFLALRRKPDNTKL